MAEAVSQQMWTLLLLWNVGGHCKGELMTADSNLPASELAWLPRDLVLSKMGQRVQQGLHVLHLHEDISLKFGDHSESIGWRTHASCILQR